MDDDNPVDQLKHAVSTWERLGWQLVTIDEERLEAWLYIQSDQHHHRQGVTGRLVTGRLWKRSMPVQHVYRRVWIDRLRQVQSTTEVRSGPPRVGHDD